MAIVTLWNGTDEQVGTTSSCIALATQLAIEHNMKILLVSTSLNDHLIKESFWTEKKKSPFAFLGGGNKGAVDRGGIEGLDRVLRSNKVTPEMITDYARVLLTNRLEILLGLEGDIKQYNSIKERYAQIITLANSYYDMVIVDLDKDIGEQTEIDILKQSHIIVAMVPQRAKEIQKVRNKIKEMDILDDDNTVLTIGRYIEDTKYNAKNITRNLLKSKDLINTIPYNNLLFEASQEGTVIDLFLDLMRLKEKDVNFNFVEEIRRLYEMITVKIKMLQMKRRI